MTTVAATESKGSGLTHDQVTEFRANGFLRVGKLLSDEDVEMLRDEYDRVFDDARRDGSFRNLAGEEPGTATEMLQIMQVCERSMPFRRLLYDVEILDAVASLIGPNIQLFHDQALYKPAHHGDAVFWHQDNGYWKCLPANLVTCWLTLDDVTAENGAMHLLPGTHLGAMSHERGEKEILFDLKDEVDASKAVVVDLPAGGAMFHHCQTMHYTPPNQTERPRRAFAIHFMPPGTRSEHSGEHLEVSFSRPMLRMKM
jgi:phytanoyl-CoA hydroxylase